MKVVRQTPFVIDIDSEEGDRLAEVLLQFVEYVFVGVRVFCPVGGKYDDCRTIGSPHRRFDIGSRQCRYGLRHGLSLCLESWCVRIHRRGCEKYGR